MPTFSILGSGYIVGESCGFAGGFGSGTIVEWCAHVPPSDSYTTHSALESDNDIPLKSSLLKR